jgi:hypothetical protein
MNWRERWRAWRQAIMTTTGMTNMTSTASRITRKATNK